MTAAMQYEGLASLLVDLLMTAEEERDLVNRELRFHLDLLADRLGAVVGWTGGAGDDSIAARLASRSCRWVTA